MFLHEYDVCGPEVEEGRQRPKGLPDVGVVRARLWDGGAQLGVAEGPDHAEEAAQAPDHQGEADAAGLADHALGGHEDAWKNVEMKSRKSLKWETKKSLLEKQCLVFFRR